MWRPSRSSWWKVCSWMNHGHRTRRCMRSPYAAGACRSDIAEETSGGDDRGRAPIVVARVIASSICVIASSAPSRMSSGNSAILAVISPRRVETRTYVGSKISSSLSLKNSSSVTRVEREERAELCDLHRVDTLARLEGAERLFTDAGEAFDVFLTELPMMPELAGRRGRVVVRAPRHARAVRAHARSPRSRPTSRRDRFLGRRRSRSGLRQLGSGERARRARQRQSCRQSAVATVRPIVFG